MTAGPMSEIDEGPGEHDAHLLDDDLGQTVPCPRCGGQVWEYAQRCPHCGVHFTGEAWEFEVNKGEKPRRRRLLWILAAILVIVAILLLAL